MILQIKTGTQTKQIVAGIRQFYSPEQLVGRTIIVVDNLQPAKLRGEDSNGMLLAVRLPEGGLRLLAVDGPGCPCGLEVSERGEYKLYSPQMTRTRPRRIGSLGKWRSLPAGTS